MGAAAASSPTQMYLLGFSRVFSDPRWMAGAVLIYVVVSQIKINVTNAYAGSLAWSNFFARLTHSHPGRVVWVIDAYTTSDRYPYGEFGDTGAASVHEPASIDP